MYKLLIVDDERHIVDWLYGLFKENAGLDVDVYKAYSGVDALDMFNRTKIDIVVSDIRMPQMSGLELIEKIHESWPRCKVIFLTGYNEFDYIYTAAKYDGVSYILKTEDDDVIVEAVVKAIESLDKSLRIDSLIDRHNNILGLLQQKEILQHVVNGDLPAASLEQKTLDEYEIPLDSQQPVIMLLGGIYASQKYFGPRRMELLSAVSILMQRYLGYEVRIAQVDYKPSGLLWLMQPLKEDHSENWEHPVRLVRENMESVQAACDTSLGIKLPCLFNTRPVSWKELPVSFAAMDSQTDYLFGSGASVVLTLENPGYPLTAMSAAVQKPPEEYKVKLNKTTLLQSYLEQGQRDEYKTLLEDILEELTQSRYCMPEQEIYYTIALMLLSYINRSHIQETLSFKIGINRLMNAESFQNWGEAKAYLRRLSDAVFEVRQSENERRGIDAITRVQQYIAQHLGEDLSLVRLAEYSNYNPSYLSRTFKKVTGSNLYTFINDARLKKAAALLKEGGENVCQIARMTGFDSSQYFSTVFKKTFQMTPQEYREANSL